MVSKIIQIGNSKGIRIPAQTLKECGIEEDIIVERINNMLIITPINKIPRAGWAEQFKKMHENNEDVLFINDSLDIDKIEWEW